MNARGARPTRNQKVTIAACGLNPREWLVVKNQNHHLLVIHRKTGELKHLNI